LRRRTCNGEVRLFILNDRIFYDLFELCSEITCGGDRVSDGKYAQSDIGLVELTWWEDEWNTCRRFVDAVEQDTASVDADVWGGCRLADIDERFALERNQMADEGPAKGV